MGSLAPRSVTALALALALAACSRPAPDATPEGAVRLWLEKMEPEADDTRALREAYPLLGPAARAKLEQRAERASRIMGRRFEPHEMLADGRFGLKFRPNFKAMTATITGDRAIVAVAGADPSERATVLCVHEPAGWRVEPEIPDLTQPAR